ncbi:hypothetical protein Q8F57_016210 [Paraburkholderia terrae]|uniref:hypothetical protein n=1 Tax=Paraburkholderia terrae TaxID=311230 RepID=UPI00296ADFD1|nr:hypothetical protein [Paraburkholderia terrae]MDW3658013.1 hypothetical protein [Paraburkholderia terrae]
MSFVFDESASTTRRVRDIERIRKLACLLKMRFIVAVSQTCASTPMRAASTEQVLTRHVSFDSITLHVINADYALNHRPIWERGSVQLCCGEIASVGRHQQAPLWGSPDSAGHSDPDVEWLFVGRSRRLNVQRRVRRMPLHGGVPVEMPRHKAAARLDGFF